LISPIVFSLALSNICPTTKLIGFDKQITEDEGKSMNHARKRCEEIYQGAPCLISFEKREENVYWALCGRKE